MKPLYVLPSLLVFHFLLSAANGLISFLFYFIYLVQLEETESRRAGETRPKEGIQKEVQWALGTKKRQNYAETCQVQTQAVSCQRQSAENH